MELHWEQQPSGRNQMQRWRLIHKESETVLMEIRISPFGETYWNFKLRKKLMRVYQRYFWKVFLEKLRFF